MNSERRNGRELSPAELEQRRNASLVAREHATGPRTEEGKAASSRNAWKHGRYSAINRQSFGLGAGSMAKLFGKPCVTTCPFHPNNPDRVEAPCSLVLDGLTHAGGSCLDKTVYVNALQSLMQAMTDNDMDGMHGVLATEMASSLQMLHHFRQEIGEKGVMVAIPMVNKDGGAVLDPNTGEMLVSDYKLNPIIPHLIRFTESLGINFAELMATPRAREKMRENEDEAGLMQSLIGAIAQRAPRKIGRTIEQPAEDGE